VREAIYHYESRTDDRFQQRPESFAGLSRRFFEAFPQLEGLRFSHQWGGPNSRERTKTRGGAASGCARLISPASDSIPDPHPLRKTLGDRRDSPYTQYPLMGFKEVPKDAK
jgi:hypothetical protein